MSTKVVETVSQQYTVVRDSISLIVPDSIPTSAQSVFTIGDSISRMGDTCSTLWETARGDFHLIYTTMYLVLQPGSLHTVGDGEKVHHSSNIPHYHEGQNYTVEYGYLHHFSTSKFDAKSRLMQLYQ